MGKIGSRPWSRTTKHARLRREFYAQPWIDQGAIRMGIMKRLLEECAPVPLWKINQVLGEFRSYGHIQHAAPRLDREAFLERLEMILCGCTQCDRQYRRATGEA